MKKLLFLAGLCLVTLFAGAKEIKLTVTVTNPSSFERSELISLPLSDLTKTLRLKKGESLVVTSPDGAAVATQTTYDGQLLIPAQMKAGESLLFTVSKGTPAPVVSSVAGALYKERKDDIAWENDRIAFRTYGPALQQSGEKAFGFDVWLKRVDTLVVADRYDKELHHHITYHDDHGNGMDCFNVGPTLGCGTPALMAADGTTLYPYCWKSYEILDNGPLRFTVKLTYNPSTVNGDNNVVETRVVSLDRGSQLNKMVVTYDNLSQETPVAAGLVIHPQNPTGYSSNAAAGWMAAIDLTDDVNNGNGVIYLGIVSPTPFDKTAFKPLEERNTKMTDAAHGAVGHLLGYSRCASGRPFTYYWGAGWSKHGIAGPKQWEEYLTRFAQALKEPLKVEIGK